MKRRLLTVMAVAVFVATIGIFSGCAFFEKDTSLSRFRAACAGLYDTIGVLTAHRQAGGMDDDQWNLVNGFALSGHGVCQDRAIEDFDAALAKVQGARAGIANVMRAREVKTGGTRV